MVSGEGKNKSAGRHQLLADVPTKGSSYLLVRRAGLNRLIVRRRKEATREGNLRRNQIVSRSLKKTRSFSSAFV